MPPTNYRTCPACESRNKAGWEYCVRCGESLQDVPLGAAASAATVVPADAPPATGGPGISSMVTTIVMFAAILGAVVFALRAGATFETSQPSASLFTIPTLPSSPLPAPSALPDTAGSRDFEEGRRLFVKGDIAGAIPLLAQAVANDGTNAEFRNVYGKALLRGGGAVDEGLRQLQEAVRLSPANPEYGSALGRAFEQAKLEKEAVAAYEAVLRSQPDYSETLEDLGRLHLREGRPDKATPVLRRAAELRPGDLPLQQDLGAALQKSGDHAGAVDVYRRILETFPRADLARGLLAETLLSQGKNDEAVATFRTGLESTPDAPLLHRGLGSALERSGRMEEAILAYRDYARLMPDSADAKAMAERASRLEQKLTAAKEPS